MVSVIVNRDSGRLEVYLILDRLEGLSTAQIIVEESTLILVFVFSSDMMTCVCLAQVRRFTSGFEVAYQELRTVSNFPGLLSALIYDRSLEDLLSNANCPEENACFIKVRWGDIWTELSHAYLRVPGCSTYTTRSCLPTTGCPTPRILLACSSPTSLWTASPGSTAAVRSSTGSSGTVSQSTL